MRSRIVLGVVLLSLLGILQTQERRGRLDEWGNPIGSNFGLAVDGEFRGKVLLAWTAEERVSKDICSRENPLWGALKAKGFHVELRTGPFDPAWLRKADQLWVFSNRSPAMTDRDYDAVVEYAESGKGLYLLADNKPFLAEANALARRLFDASIAGNYQGCGILAIRSGGLTPYDLLESRETTGGRRPRTSRKGRGTPGSRWAPELQRARGYSRTVEDHPLLTDIHFLYEGVSITHIVPTDKLDVVLTASDGQPLVAVARDPNRRVVIDCGFSRYQDHMQLPRGRIFVVEDKIPPGQIRFAENVAAYLTGKDAKR